MPVDEVVMNVIEEEEEFYLDDGIDFQKMNNLLLLET